MFMDAQLMKKRLLRTCVGISLSIFLLSLVSACEEDRLYDEGIPEGNSEVTFRMVFRPEQSVDVSRSTSGDAIRDIDNINILVYSPKGHLMEHRYISDPKPVENERPSYPDDTDGSKPKPEESSTQHVDVKMTLANGRYKIYAVANVGDLSKVHSKDIADEKTMRSISFAWNPDNVVSNSQMSGYFTVSATKGPYYGGDAPIVEIKNSGSIHCWLRRLASKVTVAIDASEMNENIYIYIKSAQLKDIPVSCKLIDDNKMTDEDDRLDSDTISFANGSESDHKKWTLLTCGRGANKIGSHSHVAKSLFFFENMQDVHKDKHKYHGDYGAVENPDSPWHKDGVANGTYLEIEGYYYNRSHDNPSYGAIKYRFMLGKNTIDDFNAERNAHYKVTLKFRNNANDPDWHIEYNYIPKPPEVLVNSPLYISYLQNRELNIPVTIFYDKEISGAVSSVNMSIVDNDWSFDKHPYNTKFPEDRYGFLNMSLSTTNNDPTYTASATFTEPDYYDEEKYRYSLPVYTRPMAFSSSPVMSGNNFFVGATRHAKVRITVNFELGGSLSQDVEVIQVPRLVNPCGVWRSYNSDKKFKVSLTNALTDDEATTPLGFDKIESQGPWTAKIVKGEDWVRIKDCQSDTWSADAVTGGTGSNVEFDYKPSGTIAESESRFGMIEVRYHDNNCYHVIFVSQGMAPVVIDNTAWHMSNLEIGDKDTTNPLLEGCMFKFGNSEQGFQAKQNLNADYGFQKDCSGRMFDILKPDGSTESLKFDDVLCDTTGFDVKGKVRVASHKDYIGLTDPERFNRYYGVMYGDECDETLMDPDESNTYTNVGDKKGMRGTFIYEKSTGKSLFFPIGNQGHGRRQYNDFVYDANWNESVHGEKKQYRHALKYANRTAKMPWATAANNPMLYNLYQEPGAVYWYGERWDSGRFESVLYPYPVYHYGFDMNYFTYGFESYGTNIVLRMREENVFQPGVGRKLNMSDACFVRRVTDLTK